MTDNKLAELSSFARMPNTNILLVFGFRQTHTHRQTHTQTCLLVLPGQNKNKNYGDKRDRTLTGHTSDFGMSTLTARPSSPYLHMQH